ncbi:MAG: hypothetical protein K9J24_09815 [Bacteroidales bacterium]|nr:hypothetical protein [Bacteroidales bacterium]
MENKIIEYLAPKIIDDFKNGKVDSNLLRVLSKGVFSKAFRNFVIKEDKDIYFKKLSDPDPNVRIFNGVVIRPIIDEYNTEDLFNYWERCEDKIEKDYFVYDLADIKQLTEKHHRRLFEYVKKNLDFFIKSKRDYLDPEIAFEELKSKMKGKTIRETDGKVVHPLTKKWIYWINILSYLDVITATDLISFLNEIDTSQVETPRGDLISEDFYTEVKKYLFKKLSLTK